MYTTKLFAQLFQKNASEPQRFHADSLFLMRRFVITKHNRLSLIGFVVYSIILLVQHLSNRQGTQYLPNHALSYRLPILQMTIRREGAWIFFNLSILYCTFTQLNLFRVWATTTNPAKRQNLPFGHNPIALGLRQVVPFFSQPPKALHLFLYKQLSEFQVFFKNLNHLKNISLQSQRFSNTTPFCEAPVPMAVGLREI